MSAERGAWSVEREAERRMSRPRLVAFTLLEVLASVAIIAIMSALLTPAVRGLLGVTGPRGGINTVSAALEQARLSALESGVPSYLGWAPETGDTASSALIVFRDKKDGEPSDYIPVTRWLKLPQGIYLEHGDTGTTNVSTASSLPKLGTNAVTAVTAVKFDRFGRLASSTLPAVIRVGAKTARDGDFLGGANQHFELTIQTLTGRAVVVDKAMEGVE